MIERVLVPVDFSPRSQQAIEYAIETFPTASIQLLHVSDVQAATVESAMMLSDDPANLQSEAELYARNELADLMAVYRVEVAHQHGSPAPGIIQQANEWGAQVIVMSSRGRQGLTRLFLGSIAESVVRDSDVPVLILPNPQLHTN